MSEDALARLQDGFVVAPWRARQAGAAGRSPTPSPSVRGRTRPGTRRDVTNASYWRRAEEEDYRAVHGIDSLPPHPPVLSPSGAMSAATSPRESTTMASQLHLQYSTSPLDVEWADNSFQVGVSAVAVQPQASSGHPSQAEWSVGPSVRVADRNGCAGCSAEIGLVGRGFGVGVFSLRCRVLGHRHGSSDSGTGARLAWARAAPASPGAGARPTTA
jgi:hypothetical protein